MGENICKWCNWQGIKLQDTETAHIAQYKKKKKQKKTTTIKNGQKT